MFLFVRNDYSIIFLSTSYNLVKLRLIKTKFSIHSINFRYILILIISIYKLFLLILKFFLLSIFYKFNKSLQTIHIRLQSNYFYSFKFNYFSHSNNSILQLHHLIKFRFRYSYFSAIRLFLFLYKFNYFSVISFPPHNSISRFHLTKFQ